MERRLEEVLAKLKYPTTEQSLESAFSSLLTTVQSEQALAQVFAAFQVAHHTNFTYLCSALHEQAPHLFLSIADDVDSPVQFDTLLSLRSKLLNRLIREASRFLTYSAAIAQRLKLEALATEQVREALPHFLTPEDTLSGLITSDAAMQVYQQSVGLFEQTTQTKLMQLGNSVRPAIEAYFQGLVDVSRMPSFFQPKFMRKLARLRIQDQKWELAASFQEELRACVAGRAMDWDLSAESAKGQLLGSLAALALSLQPDSALVQTCLARVTSRTYPASTASAPLKLRLEVLCRLYMGLINLAEPLKVCTDPELYHWLRRILKAFYEYPRESSLYESSFLNALNRSAAKHLKECSVFNENLRYSLSKEELRSRAWQSADLDWACEQLKFRYLSSEPSLSWMLHVPSAGEPNLDLWEGTEQWDLARVVLQWKVPVKQKPFTFTTQALVSVPLAIITSWVMVLPVAIRSLLEFAQSNRENHELSLKRARDMGALLGLLLVHRKLNSRFISLLGHGVGAQAVVCCLAEVAEFNRQAAVEQRMYVLDVVLLLGAADAEEVDWTLVLEAVKGRFINLFSSRDERVAKAFGPLMIRPIGCSGIGRAGVQDVDVGDVLEAQKNSQDPRKKLKQLLKLIDFCP